MLSNYLTRFISTNSVLCQTTSKSLLAELRKKTGYTFANCKKALELHENDLTKAETWLKEQAQALGWSKAEKLQGRTTSEGLIAAMHNKHYGSLIEINCETDFVARNKEFHNLAEIVMATVLKHTVNTSSSGFYNKLMLDTAALKALTADDGKSLADHTALAIGNLGENIGIRRALCINVPSNVLLIGFTHPASVGTGSATYGKYGALLAYKTESDAELIGKQLCQHIIGMNPRKIGNPEVDQPKDSSDKETALIHQEFLLDPDIKVQELLQETQTQVIDFVRFEMGEILEDQQSLDAVEIAG